MGPVGEFSVVTGDILDERLLRVCGRQLCTPPCLGPDSCDFPGVMAQTGEGLMSSLKSLNATNLMVKKSGVGVRFTCNYEAGRYVRTAIHRFEIRLNNKLKFILQFP